MTTGRDVLQCGAAAAESQHAAAERKQQPAARQAALPTGTPRNTTQQFRLHWRQRLQRLWQEAQLVRPRLSRALPALLAASAARHTVRLVIRYGYNLCKTPTSSVRVRVCVLLLIRVWTTSKIMPLV